MKNYNMSKSVILHDMPQRSPEWYAIRNSKDWTGSTIIYLLSNRSKPSNNSYDNDYMRRGRVLEALAIEAWEMTEHGMVGGTECYGFIENTKYPTCGYSPDGVWGHILLEVKCFKLEKHDHIAKTKIIPTEVMSQIQFGLMITGLKVAHLILYNQDSETPLVIIEIKPNRKITQNIRSRLSERS